VCVCVCMCVYTHIHTHTHTHYTHTHTHTHRVIRSGGCFGSTEFMSGTMSGKFKCIASEKTVILELTPHIVNSIIDRDYVHGALFYWTLCQVSFASIVGLFSALLLDVVPGYASRLYFTFTWLSCNKNVNDSTNRNIFYFTFALQVMDLDYREAMEEMFPGTWSRRETEMWLSLIMYTSGRVLDPETLAYDETIAYNASGHLVWSRDSDVIIA
jgi:hypothetical protein